MSSVASVITPDRLRSVALYRFSLFIMAPFMFQWLLLSLVLLSVTIISFPFEEMQKQGSSYIIESVAFSFPVIVRSANRYKLDIQKEHYGQKNFLKKVKCRSYIFHFIIFYTWTKKRMPERLYTPPNTQTPPPHTHTAHIFTINTYTHSSHKLSHTHTRSKIRLHKIILGHNNRRYV